jgi:hypothetical protein
MMGVSVQEVMRREVVSVQASASLHDFAQSVSAHHRHAIFPFMMAIARWGSSPFGS